ncbi:hypothetical protein ACO1MQ_13790, partial [Staphylococcus aureus]
RFGGGRRGHGFWTPGAGTGTREDGQWNAMGRGWVPEGQNPEIAKKSQASWTAVPNRKWPESGHFPRFYS